MALITNLEAANVSQTVRSLDSTSQLKTANKVSKGVFLRPADTVAYTAGDVISDSTSVAAAIEFPNCAQINGGSGEIIRCYVTSAVNYAVAPDLELFIFDEEPTNHLDNAALALADGDHVVAYLSMLAANIITLNPAASPNGRTIHPSANINRGYVCESTSKSLYGLLVTRTGITPVSAMKLDIYVDIKID